MFKLFKGPVALATMRTSLVFGLRLALQAAALLLVARTFGPEVFGAFAGLAALAVLLGTLSTFGTHLVLLAEGSRAYRRRLRVLPYCVTTTLLAGCMLLLVYLVLAVTLLPMARVSIEVVAAIGITELILQPLLLVPSVQLQAQRLIARSQLLMLVPLFIRGVAATFIFLLQPSDPLLVYVYGCVAGALLGLICASKLVPGAWPAFRHWRLARMPELRHSAGYAVLSTTAAGPSELDKTLAVRLLLPAAAGVYSAATRLIWATALPVVAMVQSVLPTLFRTASDRAGIRREMLSILYLSAFGYGVFVMLALWFASPLITQLFGVDYHEIQRAIRWICAAVPALTLRQVSGALLLAVGRPWSRVAFEMSGILVVGAVAIVLAPHMGMAGMAIAIVSAEYAMAGIGGYLVYTGKLRNALPAMDRDLMPPGIK